MILSDTEIRKAIEAREIAIENGSGNFEPASYDLRVGDFAVTRNGRVDVGVETSVTIGRGETAVVYPCEKITLGLKHVARFGLMSRLARRGLILLSGPQIDPGYSGWLEVTVFNAGNASITLVKDEPFATIEFERLLGEASRGYSGPYMQRPRANSEVIDLMKTSRLTFAEYEDKFKELESKYTMMERVTLASIAGLVVGSVLLFGKALIDMWVKG